MATTSNAGLFWPYSLMLMGMNSNRTEDVMPMSMREYGQKSPAFDELSSRFHISV